MPSPDSASDPMLERLDLLGRGCPATIARIAWDSLRENEARRMRELGFDEGVRVEKLHAGPLGQDPIAIRVGRMTIAIRRAQAAAVCVRLDDAEAERMRGIGAGALDGLAIAAE